MTRGSILAAVLAASLVALVTLAPVVEGNDKADRWAILVSSSRFWHNYRHAANALSFYHILKDRRIPDSNIILMLADHYACDPRNTRPATMYNGKEKQINLHRCDLSIDFTGYQVSVRTTLELLQGLYDPLTTPRSRILNSGPNSNILWYMTGHGGEGFLKYHDTETLTDEDLEQTIDIMHSKKRYAKMLIIIETCNGAALCYRIKAPNVVCVTSSHVGEDSWSLEQDRDMGVHVIDRFTAETLQYFKQLPKSRRRTATLWEMLNYYRYDRLRSHVYWNANQSTLMDWKVSEFFEESSLEEEPMMTTDELLARRKAESDRMTQHYAAGGASGGRDEL